MNRHNEIKNAYHSIGGDHTFYDGMITCSTLAGKAVCKLVWDMNKTENDRYLEMVFSNMPRNFSGRMLEVPVGTGVLTMPIYATLPKADIICLDYSAEMMERAKRRATLLELSNVNFQQGDVGKLPFQDETFDLVLSLNGFHAFPDKKAAYNEIFRVLKPGGNFCGCFYVQGENRRTDWLIQKFYVPKGFFTPPFETMQSLKFKLNSMYAESVVYNVKAMACFSCKK